MHKSVKAGLACSTIKSVEAYQNVEVPKHMKKDVLILNVEGYAKDSLTDRTALEVSRKIVSAQHEARREKTEREHVREDFCYRRQY